MITVTEIDESNRHVWDREIARFHNVHPFNAFGWGKVRSFNGWVPTYLMARRENRTTGAVMLLRKTIPILGMSLMYAPRGPVFDLSDRDTLKALLAGIREEAMQHKALFLRIDPMIRERDWANYPDVFVEEGFIHLKQRWTYWNAPRDVYHIDLTRGPTTAHLFQTINRQARKAVQKAEKEGVVIQASMSLEDLKVFYLLFRQFSIEKRFMSRGYEYQKSLWDEFISNGNGQLFLAFYGGATVAGLLVIRFEKGCLAMHMGTLGKYRGLRTDDALVWAGMKWAKENGCEWYSFRGMGSSPTEERFKRKFRPEPVSLIGYYDFPFCPRLYRLFAFAEFQILPRAWPFLMAVRAKTKNLAVLRA